jgi:hypothetical protein
MVSLEFSESDEWTADNGGALHPLSAAEHYARLLDNSLPECETCTKIQINYQLFHCP